MEPKKLGELFGEYARLAGELADLEPDVIVALRGALRDGMDPEELAQITGSFVRETARFMSLVTGLVTMDKITSTAAAALKAARELKELKEQEQSPCEDCPFLGICTQPDAEKFRSKESTN